MKSNLKFTDALSISDAQIEQNLIELVAKSTPDIANFPNDSSTSNGVANFFGWTMLSTLTGIPAQYMSSETLKNNDRRINQFIDTVESKIDGLLKNNVLYKIDTQNSGFRLAVNKAQCHWKFSYF